MEIPETRYAKALDGTHLAYKVLGEGPVDWPKQRFGASSPEPLAPNS